MNIIEAAKELKSGKYIRRKEWVGFIFVFFNNNSLLFKYSQDEKIIDLNLKLNDLLADDWEILEE
jgi:hypothetical protein